MRSLVLTALLFSYMPVALWHPFFGALLWTWISIMNPHREVWGFAASLPIAMLVGLATIFGWVFSREAKRFSVNGVSIIFLGLMIIISISTVFALSQAAAWQKWDKVIKTLFMAVLILSMTTNKVRIHALVWVLCLSLGYFGVKGGIFTLFSGGGSRVLGPESTYIHDNNHLAMALIMIVPLLNYLRINSERFFVRVGLAAAMGLSTMSAIFTYSRGGLFGLASMCLVFWIRSKQKTLFSALFISAAIVFFAAAPERIMERIQSIGNYQEDGSARARFEIWNAAFQIWLGNPILGGGLRATESPAVVARYSPGTAARAVHNSHLEILVENGIFGFLMHVGLIVCVWTYSSRTIRLAKYNPELGWARDLGAALQASLAAYVTGGSFLSLAYYDGWLYLPMIAAAMYSYAIRTQRQVHNSPPMGLSRLASAHAGGRK